jgi:hypothetical protein
MAFSMADKGRSSADLPFAITTKGFDAPDLP